MNFEDSDNDFNYDSDKVDEELETQLYGAVFFDTCLSSGDRPDVSEILPQNATGGVDYPDKSVLASNAASTVMVSSFQGEASADSDGFSIRNSPLKDDDDQNVDSTSCYSTPSNSQSIHNGLPCFTIGSSGSVDEVSQSGTDDWDASDVVIGVSKHSKSMVCNADDCEAIARRLAWSRSDPSLWRVSRSDRFSNQQTKRASRYFDDSYCSNCRQRGHFTSSCQRAGPVCILCGEENHEKDSCPNVYCYICFSFGHSKASCSLANTLRQSVCQRCGQQGHNSKLCTEIWRQYITTTEEGKPTRTPKRLLVRPRGCCNCGRKNHIGEDCMRRAFRSNIPGPLPHRRVRVYDKKDIYARLRRVMEKKTAKVKARKQKKETTSSKKKKKKQGSMSLQDDYAPVEDKPVSLQQEQARVEQHLFNCFSCRLQAQSAASPSVDSGKSLETRDPPTSAVAFPQGRPRRADSGDGDDFLPLSGTPLTRGRGGHAFAGRKRAFPQTRPFSTTRESPFTWINRSTSFQEINDQPSNRDFYPRREKHFHPVKPSESTSSLSYHDRWRRAAKRRAESPLRMNSSKTCPSLLSLDCDSRRSRKQQQQQWRRRKGLHEANSLPSVFETEHRAKKKMSFKPKKNKKTEKVIPVDRSPSRQNSQDSRGSRESRPRKLRSSTPGTKSKRKNWVAFVNRSADVEPWD